VEDAFVVTQLRISPLNERVIDRTITINITLNTTSSVKSALRSTTTIGRCTLVISSTVVHTDSSCGITVRLALDLPPSWQLEPAQQFESAVVPVTFVADGGIVKGADEAQL